MFSGVANSIIEAGAHIHVFVLTDHQNNQFQNKLIAAEHQYVSFAN